VFERVAGANRFETAAAVAMSYGPGVPVVYVATGTTFPDALAGGSPAALDEGPLLLVHAGGVPPAVRDTLEWLRPEHITVLGGAGAVPDAVEQELARYAPTVGRIAGSDRFATAARIADTFPAPQPVVFVATGSNFPDALAGAPAAALLGSPLILAAGDHVPAVAMDQVRRLQPEVIVVLGGEGVVSRAVVEQLTRG
jgi:putative cell wall-binding protein